MSKNVASILRPLLSRYGLVYFYLSGSAAGLYLHLFWNNTIVKYPSVDMATTLINMLPAGMTASGLALFSLDIRRKSICSIRVGSLFKSGKMQIVFCGAIFTLITILNAASGSKIVACINACSAFSILLTQGIVFSVRPPLKAVKRYLSLLFIFAVGISNGYGIWILLRVSPRGLPGDLWCYWGAWVVLLNLMAWGGYLWLRKGDTCENALMRLQGKAPLLAVFDGGIPLLALTGLFFSGLAAGSAKIWVLCLGGCCGISLCIGGWVKLYAISRS